MTEYQKAEAGLLYQAHLDPEVDKGRRRSQELNYDYNMLRPCQLAERDKMIRFCKKEYPLPDSGAQLHQR